MAGLPCPRPPDPSRYRRLFSRQTPRYLQFFIHLRPVGGALARKNAIKVNNIVDGEEGEGGGGGGGVWVSGPTWEC